MIPRIETLSEKRLVGKHLKMSFSNNRTTEIWQSFMAHRKKISNAISSDLYSVQLYKADYFSNFNASNEFEKWAAMEVFDFDNVPENMKTFVLPSGLYAVFHYIGLNTNVEIFQYIFETWLPKSEYLLDNRPHFEILGEKYKNNDPDSEEEIWVPIIVKSLNC